MLYDIVQWFEYSSVTLNLSYFRPLIKASIKSIISLHILLLFLFFYHIYALVLCYFI